MFVAALVLVLHAVGAQSTSESPSTAREEDTPQRASGNDTSTPPATVSVAADQALQVLTGEISASRSELTDLATVLRLSRRFELSAEIYGRLHEAHGDLSALFLQAQQLAQLGEFESAGRLARRVVQETQGEDTASYELKRRAYALMARTLFYRGRLSEAEQLLSTLAALDEAELVEADALLLLAAVESGLGKESAARSQLERLYPSSLATERLSGQIQPLGTPASLLETLHAEYSRDVASSPGDGTPRETERIPVQGIQVGSFSDPDNANHMARDIEALGLQTEIREQTREGRSIQVVVALVADRSGQSAERVLSTLRDAGFDGFLIY